MKNPPLSVRKVSMMLEPITGSRPRRNRVSGISTPAVAATHRLNSTAMPITPDKAMLP